MTTTNIAIACQGGGSHAAYAAGVLATLLPQFANRSLAASPELASRAQEGLNLVGLSGTSGGAITALLGWYGFITGGPAAAEQKLAAFWEANSARLPGERWWNTWSIAWANALPVDLKCSPYLWPLRNMEDFASGEWPRIAQALGRFNQWMREDYFRLGDLIDPLVDFELIGALGEFASIPLEIQRWDTVDLELRLSDPNTPRGAELAGQRRQLQEQIVRKLGVTARLQAMTNSPRVGSRSLLRTAMARWREPAYAFELDSLKRLAAAVLDVTRFVPQLLVGAVEIDNGAFIAFSSERAPEERGISLASVLASAALPWLFKAQEVKQRGPDGEALHTHLYWDGLFSQNPPIKDFVSNVPAPERKPDGIWVVQIHPEDLHVRTSHGVGDGNALWGSQIWTTRDALAGNLSLNQEVAFIESINKRIDDGRGASDGSDKHIQVHRIVMDGMAVGAALHRPLGAYSRFDRSLELKNALVAHGRVQAERFLALRADLAGASANLGSMLHRLAPQGVAPAGLASVPAAIRADTGVHDAGLVVDGMTVHRQVHADRHAEPLASVRWHTRGASVDGNQVRIDGQTGLYDLDGKGQAWQLCDVHIKERAPNPQLVAQA
jgi:predicted acylesterase/phospholipase RssA